MFGTVEFDEMEAKGLEAAAKTGFVLVSCCHRCCRSCGCGLQSKGLFPFWRSEDSRVLFPGRVLFWS